MTKQFIFMLRLEYVLEALHLELIVVVVVALPHSKSSLTKLFTKKILNMYQLINF